MLNKHFTTENGNFELIVHNANSIGIRCNALTVNRVEYNLHVQFEVKDMILTTNYYFVNRNDMRLDVSYSQKQKVVEVAKSEAFDYIFCNRELLDEAEKQAVSNKLKSLMRERDEIFKKFQEKSAEVLAFYDKNTESLQHEFFKRGQYLVAVP